MSDGSAGRASWLTNDVLLLISDPGEATGDETRHGEGLALDARVLELPSPAGGDSGPGALLQVVIFPERSGSDSGWQVTDLKTLIRHHLAPLDAATRNRITNFLASATADRAGPGLSARLAQVCAALRERLPRQRNSPDEPRGLSVEHILPVDERSFYLKGWIHDEEAEIVRLTVVSPEGARAEVHHRLFRSPRPDVVQWSNAFRSQPPRADLGMICFFELDAPNLLADSWVVEMENAAGTAVELTAASSPHDFADVRSSILHDCVADGAPDDRLMADHIVPAMARLKAPLAESIGIAKVVQIGEPPEAPEVSIVIPIYRHMEHLEAQLAEFTDDPAIRASDLIYVLDSPELQDEFADFAARLHPIYRVPLRIAIMEQNMGFAAACNAGASVARGRLLLLLNSDVLPDEPGWLETMCEFYDSTPDIGALGPKMVYEDDSIQHAGMHFFRPPGASLWQDSHYFRGLHRSFPAANVVRRVPAVSGACMMIDRGLFEELGGLSGQYATGDYEDFDICLRLIEAGRENWYLPDSELYHLEGQSYTSEQRRPANRFNVWLHTHLWRERIEELMESEEWGSSTSFARRD